MPCTTKPPASDQVASDLTSTPVGRQSDVIAAPTSLSQSPSLKGFDPLSSDQQRQSATEVAAVISHELDGRLYYFSNLLTDFILAGSWAIDASQAESILSEAAQRAMPPGLVYDAVTHQYTCTPPQYTDLYFPDWFCQLGNTIADIGVTNTPTHGKWASTTGGELGTRNGNICPDFVLSSGTGWRAVLVVGEHQSSGEDDSPEPGKLKLACCAEQVFFAQPFRNMVWGIWTSKSRPEISCWRFDRAGGIGLTMDFSSTETGLNDVVRCLHAFNHMDPAALGIFTTDISWNMTGGGWHALDEASGIVVHLNRNGITTPDLPETQSTISLQSLLYVAPGIVTRGSRIWKGLLEMSGTETEVVVKYAWRSPGLLPEGELNLLAMARGVVGLPRLFAYDSYGDIHLGARGGHMPIHSRPPTHWTSKAVPKSYAKSYATYNDYMGIYNNTYNRLVFGGLGTPILDEKLSPLAVARALLAAVIGHASLFFDGQILHRDVTPGNIISFSDPVTISPPSSDRPVCTPGTQIFGSLIDLDYAAQTATLGPSGIAEWTGALPFVAINVLLGEDGFQRYRHDLESFFYVLVWISCYYRCPSPMRSKVPPNRSNSIWPSEHPLCDWEEETIAMLAAHKTAYIVSNTGAFEDLLTHFQPGLEAFRDAARSFRLALWGAGDGTGECKVFTEGSGSMPEPMVTRRGAPIPRPNRISADEVRLGVSNWEGYLEVRQILEVLVEDLCEEQGKTGGDNAGIQ